MEDNLEVVYWSRVSTINGEYILMATEKGICWVGLPNSSLEKGKLWLSKHLSVKKFREKGEHPALKKAAHKLKMFIKGEKIEFNVPFDIYGTSFQKQVWEKMAKIKYGTTNTYKDLALAVGRPKASRAIGVACRTNPLAIFIPCHRVVGSNGKLTGYAGGLSTKEWLLQLEKSKSK